MGQASRLPLGRLAPEGEKPAQTAGTAILRPSSTKVRRINCAPVRHCAGLPHDGQNFSPLNFAPQWVQKADLTVWTGSPQLPQNLAPDAMSDPHLAHLMTWAGVVKSMP